MCVVVFGEVKIVGGIEFYGFGALYSVYLEMYFIVVVVIGIMCVDVDCFVLVLCKIFKDFKKKF